MRSRCQATISRDQGLIQEFGCRNVESVIGRSVMTKLPRTTDQVARWESFDLRIAEPGEELLTALFRHALCAREAAQRRHAFSVDEIRSLQRATGRQCAPSAESCIRWVQKCRYEDGSIDNTHPRASRSERRSAIIWSTSNATPVRSTSRKISAILRVDIASFKMRPANSDIVNPASFARRCNSAWVNSGRLRICSNLPTPQR